MLSSIALLRYWSRRAICVYLILCRWAWSEYLTKSRCVPNRKPPSETAAVSIHKVAKSRNRPIKYQSRSRDLKIENKTEKWRTELCIGLCIRQLWSNLASKSIHHFLDLHFIYGFSCCAMIRNWYSVDRCAINANSPIEFYFEFWIGKVHWKCPLIYRDHNRHICHIKMMKMIWLCDMCAGTRKARALRATVYSHFNL